jgi:hypothetical protein
MRSLKKLAIFSIVIGLSSVGLAQAAAPPSRYVSLLIQDTGGYTPVDYAFARTPTVLYSDGLLIVPSKIHTLQSPGQFVETFRQKRGLAAVPRILAAAEKIHLTDPKFDWGMPWIVDVPDTMFVTQISPKAPQTKLSIYALGFDEDVMPKSKAEARRAASSFRDKIESFSSGFFFSKSKPTVWKPTKWLYMANESQTDAYTKTYKWFGAKPLEFNAYCREMTSLENSKLNALLPKLNSSSRFSSNGRIWRITVRPLFPHETGCQSIIN